MIKKFSSLVTVVLLLQMPLTGICADSQAPLRAAIFVQNLAGGQLDDQIAPLSNQLAARLTEKGFTVVDRNDVMAKFSESRDRDASAIKATKALSQLATTGKSDTMLDDALAGGSALRIAQLLKADYLIMATMNSLGTEVRTFKGERTAYGTNNQTTIFNLKLALKVLEGGQGGTIYGDVVTASERVSVGENLSIVTTDHLTRLIEAASVKAVDAISSRVDQMRNVKTTLPSGVTFTVKSNIEGATVELDGMVMGATPGQFTASSGIHQLRVTKEWMTNWERSVNIVSDQIINVSLELSEEGLKQYKSLEGFKAEIEIAKKLSEGQKKMLENSSIKYQGAPTTNIIH